MEWARSIWPSIPAGKHNFAQLVHNIGPRKARQIPREASRANRYKIAFEVPICDPIRRSEKVLRDTRKRPCRLVRSQPGPPGQGVWSEGNAAERSTRRRSRGCI